MAQVSVAGSWEPNNESWRSKRAGEFVDWLSKYQLLKGTAVWDPFCCACLGTEEF